MESLFTNRKGQGGINAIGALAMAVLIGAVILGLGGTILDKIKTTQSDNQATTANNESLTWAGNNTAISLTQQENIVADSETVYNATDKFSTSEYVFNATSATIIFFNQTNGTWLTDSLNITYKYRIGSAALNTSISGLSGVNQMASFIPTIAIVAIAGLVIGILLLFFGRRKET